LEGIPKASEKRQVEEIQPNKGPEASNHSIRKPMADAISLRVLRLYRSPDWISAAEFENEIKLILKAVFNPVLGGPRREAAWPFLGSWVNPLNTGLGTPYVCFLSF
jgi:hypothetical protein